MGSGAEKCRFAETRLRRRARLSSLILHFICIRCFARAPPREMAVELCVLLTPRRIPHEKTALFVFAGAMLLSGHALADAASLKDSYVPGAFDSADDDWRRITVNRTAECGEFGRNDNRRIDILISRYEALGEALERGNAAAIDEAAESLNSAVTANRRFERCWDVISRKKGVGSDFKREVEKA